MGRPFEKNYLQTFELGSLLSEQSDVLHKFRGCFVTAFGEAFGDPLLRFCCEMLHTDPAHRPRPGDVADRLETVWARNPIVEPLGGPGRGAAGNHLSAQGSALPRSATTMI